jgi:branched-chain amino acid transport system permease protein
MCIFLVTPRQPRGVSKLMQSVGRKEVFAQTMGKNTLRFKITAFAVSAILAALAGSLYAHYITYIDPTSFTVMESILVISMVIIDGAGGLWGPMVGAIVLVMLPQALRFLGLPSSIAANLRQIVYGVLLVVMMMIRPGGLMRRYGFGR